MTNGVSYDVRVRACNTVGCGLWSLSATDRPQAQATAPGQVSRPSLTPGDRSLTASWSAPSTGGSAITRYEVQHKLTSSSWPSGSGNNNGTSRTRTITGLTNGVSYDVRVRACNTVGCGAWSLSATDRPQAQATAPGQVSRPSLTPGDRSLTASWSAPSTGGSAITRYEVQHKLTSSSWPSGSGNNNGTSRTRTITGLTNGVSYDVRVRACNTVGCGLWSLSATDRPQAQATAPGQVSRPSLTPGDRSLTASWSAPSTGGSAITRYEVQHKLTSSSWPSGSGNNNGTSRTRTITGLTNGVSYDVRVRACNTVGCGLWSLSATRKPRTTPNKVSLPTLTGDSGSLTASWSAPSTGGSAITRYEVRYKLTTAAPPWTDAGSVSFATQKRITGLTQGASYDVQVRACNIAGCGLWSDSATEKAEVKLAKPTSLDVQPLPLRRAQLTWAPGANADANTVYDVYTQDPTGASSVIASNIASASDGHVMRLDNIVHGKGLGHEDYFKLWVVAKDKAGVKGNSEASDTITIKDSPILSINGDSNLPVGHFGPVAGKAIVKWSQQNDATSYTIRWRKLGPDRMGRPHSDLNWKLDGSSLPNAFIGEETITDPSRLMLTIQPLDLDAIYAIQFNYKRTAGGREESVFAARDLYVWPSTQAVSGGNRVATFPLNNPFPNKTYSYVFCEDTFPASNASTWKDFIDHAFSQWEIATDHLITIRRIIRIDGKKAECADYSSFVAEVRAGVVEFMRLGLPGGRPPTDAQIEVHTKNLLDNFDQSGIESTRNQDRMLSEVYMIDDVTNAVLVNVGVSPGVFDEVSNRVGHGWCIRACTPRGVDPVVTADVKLRRSIYQNDPLTFPGSDLIANKDDIAFNSCRTTTSAYSTLVHEAGHALGIAYGNSGLGQDKHHPTIRDEAAMSYLTRHDCSPHPFDIMAIYALYQTDD